jgi:hypothetical protein
VVTVENLTKFLNPVRKCGDGGKLNEVFESCEKMW